MSAPFDDQLRNMFEDQFWSETIEPRRRKGRNLILNSSFVENSEKAEVKNIKKQPQCNSKIVVEVNSYSSFEHKDMNIPKLNEKLQSPQLVSNTMKQQKTKLDLNKCIEMASKTPLQETSTCNMKSSSSHSISFKISTSSDDIKGSENNNDEVQIVEIKDPSNNHESEPFVRQGSVRRFVELFTKEGEAPQTAEKLEKPCYRRQSKSFTVNTSGRIEDKNIPSLFHNSMFIQEDRKSKSNKKSFRSSKINISKSKLSSSDLSGTRETKDILRTSETFQEARNFFHNMEASLITLKGHPE